MPSRLLVRVLSFGGTRSGSSRLAVVTSTSSSTASRNVSCVPHIPQKLRFPCALERKCCGVPFTSRNSSGRTLNQATNGAPVVLTTDRAVAVGRVERLTRYCVTNSAAVASAGQHGACSSLRRASITPSGVSSRCQWHCKRAFRQPDRLADQTFAQAGRNGVAEGLIIDVVLSDRLGSARTLPRCSASLILWRKAVRSAAVTWHPCHARRSIISTNRSNR